MGIKSLIDIQKWAKDLDEVFTLSDLKVILNKYSEVSVYKQLVQLIENGVLLKIKRGIYATKKASLLTISHRINPNAYISTGTVLSKHAIIGSVPARRIQAVKTGRPRQFECSLGTIEHLSIDPKLYFGFSSIKGILFADPEKAFLDACYFYYKRKKFSFNLLSDVNVEDLDFKKILKYLNQYDRRFVTFFNKRWVDSNG